MCTAPSTPRSLLAMRSRQVWTGLVVAIPADSGRDGACCCETIMIVARSTPVSGHRSRTLHLCRTAALLRLQAASGCRSDCLARDRRSRQLFAQPATVARATLDTVNGYSLRTASRNAWLAFSIKCQRSAICRAPGKARAAACRYVQAGRRRR